MPHFAYVATIQACDPPTGGVQEAVVKVLAAAGLHDRVNDPGSASDAMVFAGTSHLRGDQLVSELRDRLDEVAKGLTVTVAEPKRKR